MNHEQRYYFIGGLGVGMLVGTFCVLAILITVVVVFSV